MIPAIPQIIISSMAGYRLLPPLGNKKNHLTVALFMNGALV